MLRERMLCTQLMTYLNTGWPEAKKTCSVAVQPCLISHEISVHEGIVFRGERVVEPAILTSRSRPSYTYFT